MTDERERGPRGETALKTRARTQKPRLYKVILHNDDYTTQEFVVDVLVRFFEKPVPEATRLMLHVHTKGRAVAGTYPYDIAESKVERVTRHARSSGHPLLLTTEPE
ncbi:MAG: ATP-dependent Clp protease adaptor ClpS [Myxococcales bacterium]|nr:ATP-dependent Clp protease adaptor ClpS [Myxococcales bacterium]